MGVNSRMETIACSISTTITANNEVMYPLQLLGALRFLNSSTASRNRTRIVALAQPTTWLSPMYEEFSCTSLTMKLLDKSVIEAIVGVSILVQYNHNNQTDIP